MDTPITTTRDAWLAARRRTPNGWLLGASEAAAVLGWSRFDDRFALWHRKHGLMPESAMDEHREAGLFLEAGILRWYASKTERPLVLPDLAAAALIRVQGSQVWHSDEQHDAADRVWSSATDAQQLRADALAWKLAQTFFVHYGPDVDGRVTLASFRHPWLAVSPDAFAMHEEHGWGFIDAKNLDYDRAWDAGAKVPPEYAAQIAHASLPTEFRWGGFAVCIAGQRLLVVDVVRDDMREIEELLLVEGPAFVDALEHDLPPPPMGSDASLECLRARWPKHDPTKGVAWVGEIEAAGRLWDPLSWDEAYVNALEQRAAWRQEVDDLEVVIRHVAKDAGVVAMPGGLQYLMRDAGQRIRRRAGR